MIPIINVLAISLRIMESSKEELCETKEKFISPDEEKRLSLESSIRHHARMQAIICLVLWISGLMTYSISEWYHSDPTQEPLLSMPRHKSTVYLSHCGIVICLTGYYGFWAALRQVHSMIFGFSYIVFITSIVEISGGAVILSYLEQPIRDNALRIIVNQTKAFTMENPRIFRLQILLKCCGADFPGDWVGSAWWQQQREKNTSFVVPPSCCLTGSIIRQKELSCNKGQPPYEEVLDSKLIHQKGCSDVAKKRRKELLLIAGITFLLSAIVKMVGFFGIHCFVNSIAVSQQQLKEIPPEDYFATTQIFA